MINHSMKIKRTKIRRLTLCTILLLCPLLLTAQENPYEGYIITLHGDTIHGTIDYLSDQKNATECRFKASGESTFVSYTPDEISGYRLADESIFYVSRILPINGKEQLVFAEYLIKGGIDLYRYNDDTLDHLYISDSHGHICEIRADAIVSHQERDQQLSKRSAIGKAAAILEKDAQAMERLWKMDIKASTLSQYIQEYNRQYCEEAGECIVYHYDARRSNPLSIRWYAGIGFGMMRYTDSDPDVSAKGNHYILSANADFITRNNKHLIPQLGVELIYNRIHRYQADDLHINAKGEYIGLGVSYGVMYQFVPQNKVSPFFKAGAISAWPLKEKFTDRSTDKEYQLNDQKFFGTYFYVGGGTDLKIGNKAVRIDLNYRYSFNKERVIALKAGLIF